MSQKDALMNDLTACSAEEKHELLDRIQEALGNKRMEDLLEMPLRHAMIEEYQRMASASLQLVNMLERYGFVHTLREDDDTRYRNILKSLADSSTRCTALVAESRKLDQDALLAGAEVDMRIIN